ncbi:MAG: ABC transporter substrate-binding protein [Actinomycetota bacterium]|nr:ABC transporter substrate-binding protein [Actinomycetota bacterium]
MRRFLLAFLVLGLLLSACAEETATPAAGGSTESGSSKSGCDLEQPPLFKDGELTVATDRPAYPPWFEGSPKNYSGYEGEIANEIAKRMELDITWVVEPFNKSYAPGAKNYDFDINQISVTPERAEAVDFSNGYFQNNQGLLAPEGTPITEAESLAELKDFTLGAQVGTTSLSFINTKIQPTNQVQVFDTTNDLKSALSSGQIDGFFTDVVTTVFLRDFEIKGSEVVGQYPTDEQFGMLFEKGNPLVECVNEVLGEMIDDGTVQALQDEWLQDYLGVPEFSD